MDLNIEVLLECAALPEDLRVVAAVGEEAVNELSRWDVTILTSDVGIALDEAIGAQAVLRFADAGEGASCRASPARIRPGSSASSTARPTWTSCGGSSRTRGSPSGSTRSGGA